MNKINWFYASITTTAILVGLGMAHYFFPQHFFTVALISLIPLGILGIGFHIITNRRIEGVRNQLTQIIGTLEEFDVDEPKKVIFEKSTYPLFNELNESILELIERIRSNYQANRQFTQNASHELQTPLAIIKGHGEILLNSPHLKEKEVTSLGVILQNTNRLAKLNHALILLSKIENNRYSDVETVTIQQVISEMLTNFKDLIVLQEIKITKDFGQELNVEMSETLAEILFANLFQNAIRYNVEDGFIRIQIKERTVTISNSGEVLEVPPASLFKRFKRESTVEESLGLGLSIVQRICDLYDIQITYLHQHGLHQLILVFP